MVENRNLLPQRPSRRRRILLLTGCLVVRLCAYTELVQGTTTLTASDNTNAGTGKKYQRAHRHLVLLLHILGHATTGMILVPHEQEASSKKIHVGGTPRINHQRHIASGDIFERLLSENVDAHLLVSFRCASALLHRLLPSCKYPRIMSASSSWFVHQQAQCSPSQPVAPTRAAC